MFSSLSKSWRSRHSRFNAVQMRSVQFLGRHRGDFVPSQAVKTLAAGGASDVRSAYRRQRSGLSRWLIGVRSAHVFVSTR